MLSTWHLCAEVNKKNLMLHNTLTGLQNLQSASIDQPAQPAHTAPMYAVCAGCQVCSNSTQLCMQEEACRQPGRGAGTYQGLAMMEVADNSNIPDQLRVVH